MSKMENGQQKDANIAPNMARATIKVRVLDDPKRSEDEFLDRLEVSEVSRKPGPMCHWLVFSHI